MQITAIDVQKKIEELSQRKEQLIAEANMVYGAIECCKDWLRVLMKEEEKPAEAGPAPVLEMPAQKGAE